jgi:hypothetical protein
VKSLIATLWDKISFRKKKLKYQINEDFQLVQSDDGKITGIGILKGKYAGVLYHYGQAKIVEEVEAARMVFDYTLINTGDFTLHELQTDGEFHTMIGDILTLILMEKADEETRNHNTEEFDIQ